MTNNYDAARWIRELRDAAARDSAKLASVGAPGPFAVKLGEFIGTDPSPVEVLLVENGLGLPAGTIRTNGTLLKEGSIKALAQYGNNASALAKTVRGSSSGGSSP